MVAKSEQPTLRQQQIAVAATKILLKEGSKGLTMRTIAKEIGINNSSIYQHFRSKREIISLVIDNLADEIERNLSRIPIDSELSLDKLENLIRKNISSAGERVLLSQTIRQSISPNDKELHEKISGLGNKVITSFMKLLSKEIELGHVKEDVDLIGAARVLMAIISDVAPTRKAKKQDADFEEKFVPIWRFFRYAIAKR